MKKIKILTSLTILAATAIPTVTTLSNCGGGETPSTVNSIPVDMLDVQSNILCGLKEGASIDAYDTLLIPDDVVYIADGAFKNAFVEETNSGSSIKTVIFNKNLRGIGSEAFEGCTSLTSLDFTNMEYMKLMSLILVDDTVFTNCSNEAGTIKLRDDISDTQYEWVKSQFKNAGLPGSWFGQKEVEHRISTSTLVEKTGITSDVTTLTDKNEVNISINNARNALIYDANLTIQVGQNHVNVPFKDGVLGKGATTLTYTRQSLQALFPSYTFQNYDAISFTLVRSGAYEVKDDGQIYKFDDFGNSTVVTLEQLPTLNGKFFVKSQETSDYILSDAIFPDSENAFYDLFYYAPALDDGKSYDVYLIYGEFFAVSWDRSRAKTQFNMHGIVYNDAQGKPQKQATIRAYKTAEEGRAWNYGIGVSENIALTFEDLIIKGSVDGCWESGEGDYGRGLMSANLSAFKNCYFSGPYAHWYSKTKFENCTFDTTNSWNGDGSKTNYAFWVYQDAQAWLEGCTFNSSGKCIKLYPGGKDKTVNVVNGCTFNLYQKTVYDKTGKYPAKKGLINIGTDEIHSLTSDVYYKDLTWSSGDFPDGIIQWAEGTASPQITIHVEEIPDPW